MGRKHVGWLLAALGAALIVVSAFADGLGLGDKDGIGLQQSIGMIVGAAAVLVGIWLLRRDRGTTESAGAGI